MYLLRPYDDALHQIISTGVKKTNRTGVGTIAVFGILSRYNISEGFPLLTGREIPHKAVFAELLWFLSGSTNNKDLQKLGVNIWTPWVDEAFEKKHGYAPGSFGPVYGFQLRHFNGFYGNGIGGREFTQDTEVDPCTDFGDLPYSMYGFGGFDQLAWMVNRIKTQPDCRRILFSLWNPRDTDKMRLPPCFVKGTFVQTDKGYRVIEDVKAGDLVWSSGGWQSVTENFITPYSGKGILLTMAYSRGLPVRCTPNHPFLVRGRGYVPASTVQKGDYVAMRLNTESKLPVFKEHIYVNQYAKKTDFEISSPDDWYMMGYFLGDGWASKNSSRISFAIAAEDEEYILPMIRKSIKISRKKGEGESCSTFETRSEKWAPILRTLGHRAHNKDIPRWILDAPIECLEKLVEGYYDSDGCSNGRYWHFTTTSPKLALGMQSIFWKLGERAAIYHFKRKKKKIIQGRLVNQCDLYTLIVKKSESRRQFHTGIPYIKEGDLLWIRVEDVTEGFIGEVSEPEVHNLSVEGSHTYTANNFLNHNCHYTYQVFVDPDKGRLSGMLTQRSCDFPIGVPFNIAFYSALTMMLAQQTGYTPHEFVHSTVDSHIYLNQMEAVEEYLRRPKPDSPKLVIKAALDIFSYTMDSFEVVGYKPQPKIKIPVAV